jgi:carnitine 3-dehydrogenase
LKYPKWNAPLERRLVEGCEAQAAGRSVAVLEAKRNDVLVDMMHLFKKHKIGAGLVLAREEKRAQRPPKAKKQSGRK